MSEKRISVEGIGEIHLIKKKNVKYLRLSVKYPDIIRVSIPYYSSFRQAEKFISEKRDWILKSLDKVKLSQPKQKDFLIGDTYFTKHHKVSIEGHSEDQIKLKIKNQDAIIRIPENLNIEEVSVQDVVKKAIAEVLRKEAKNYLPDLVHDYCNKLGVRIGKLTFRNVKTVWGSCSSRNNISLNIHIMRLPDHLIEYVIVHELAHTRVKDHSQRFWDTLDSMLPNAKQISRDMKQYSPTIF